MDNFGVLLTKDRTRKLIIIADYMAVLPQEVIYTAIETMFEKVIKDIRKS